MQKRKKHNYKCCKCKHCTIRRDKNGKKDHRLDCRCQRCKWLRTGSDRMSRPTLGTTWSIKPKEISKRKLAELRKKYAKYIDVKVVT